MVQFLLLFNRIIIFVVSWLCLVADDPLDSCKRFIASAGDDELGNEVKNLNSAEDGEACEKSHRPTNETELGFFFNFSVSADLVKCGCVKEDLDQL